MLPALSLRFKLLSFGGLFVVLLLVILGFGFRVTSEVAAAAEAECRTLSSDDLDHTVQGLYAVCVTQQESLQQAVDVALKAAHKLADDAGGLHPDGGAPVSWQATNQFSLQTSAVTLPPMMLGKTPLGQNRDLAKRSPLVDEVEDVTGQTCTIFQRMNPRGDMLRVCTNVQNKEGARAIGTFIPATNPDGQPNAVVASVLAGKTYRGRAFVVKAWYITAYEPMYDRDKNIVGSLYVGVPQESVPSLRKAFVNMRVGKTGYAFVVDSKGNAIVTHAGAGTDSYGGPEAKDTGPTHVTPEMLKKAVALPPGQIGQFTSATGAAGKEGEQWLVRMTYFPAWDWIVGVTVSEAELAAAEQRIADVGRRYNVLLAAVGGAAAALALLLAWLLGRSITQPLARTVSVLEAVAAGDLAQELPVTTRDELGRMAAALNQAVHALRAAAARDKTQVEREQARATQLHDVLGQVAASVRVVTTASGHLTQISERLGDHAQSTAAQATVASAASEQVSKNVQTVAASSEEMSASIREIARSSTDAARVAGSGVAAAQHTTAIVSKLGDSSAEIGKIVKVIKSIAEQTNLLALNATIEAARAGAAGKGFAVVANEVKELAKQTAKATEDISPKIEAIQADTHGAVDAIAQIGKIINQINDIQNSIATAVEEQTITTSEISRNVAEAARGSNEIAQNIAGVAQAAQGTSEAAHHTKSSADELSKMAVALQQLVAQFK